MTGKATVGCDGLGTVKIIEKALKTTKSNMEQFDSIRAINKVRKSCNFTTQLRHVKGHQDDHSNFYNLDRWAQLNVIVDTMAKRKLSETLDYDDYQHHRLICFPHDKCTLSFCDQNQIPTTSIQSNLLKTIRRSAGRKRARKHWRKKKIIAEETEHCIDWKVVHKSHKSVDSTTHQWLSKWMTGFCRVGKMMKVYRFQTHTKCPRCQQPNENVKHVLKCQSYGTKQMRALSSWITKNDGPEGMGDVITQNLTAWRQNSMYPHPPIDTTLRKAVLQQDSLGWNNFLHGFISSKWRQAIDMHFKKINSKKSSTLWVSRLVRKIWDIQRQLWNDRNEALHGEGNTIHVEEITAINEEVLSQWTKGSRHLPTRYHHLFKGEFRLLYQSDYHRKQQWLTSIWLAREKHSPLPVTRNSIAENFYKRWHECINSPEVNLEGHTILNLPLSRAMSLLSWNLLQLNHLIKPTSVLVQHLGRTAVGRFELQHNGDKKAYMALVV
jgi:hypothetical protein